MQKTQVRSFLLGEFLQKVAYKCRHEGYTVNEHKVYKIGREYFADLEKDSDQDDQDFQKAEQISAILDDAIIRNPDGSLQDVDEAFEELYGQEPKQDMSDLEKAIEETSEALKFTFESSEKPEEDSSEIDKADYEMPDWDLLNKMVRNSDKDGIYEYAKDFDIEINKRYSAKNMLKTFKKELENL